MHSKLNGDLYSHLIAYIQLIKSIEQKAHRHVFSKGESYWWYNSGFNAFNPTKRPVKPVKFEGEYESNWILMAKTVDGVIVADTKLVEESEFEWTGTQE